MISKLLIWLLTDMLQSKSRVLSNCLSETIMLVSNIIQLVSEAYITFKVCNNMEELLDNLIFNTGVRRNNIRTVYVGIS